MSKNVTVLPLSENEIEYLSEKVRIANEKYGQIMSIAGIFNIGALKDFQKQVKKKRGGKK